MGGLFGWRYFWSPLCLQRSRVRARPSVERGSWIAICRMRVSCLRWHPSVWWMRPPPVSMAFIGGGGAGGADSVVGTRGGVGGRSDTTT
jgi:hypothetical protein